MARRCDVIAATAVDDLGQRGLPVFSLLSDFAQGIRAGHVDLDNLKVGRTAAWVISLTAQGTSKVALFVSGARLQAMTCAASTWRVTAFRGPWPRSSNR